MDNDMEDDDGGGYHHNHNHHKYLLRFNQQQQQSSSTTNRHQFSINECETMIELIKNCELIWDKNHPQYSHGITRSMAFEKIAQQLSIPVEDIRWKWQIFRKEYFKKISQSNRSINNGGQKPRPWKWASQLSFLNTVIAHNNQKNNMININKTTKSDHHHHHQKEISLISNVKNVIKTSHHCKSSSSLSTNQNGSSMSLLALNHNRILTNANGKLNRSQSEEDYSSEQTSDHSVELLAAAQLEDVEADEEVDDNNNNNNNDDDNIDDDQDLPKFFCETIYSPPPEEDDNDESNDNDNELIKPSFTTIKQQLQTGVNKKSNNGIANKNQIIYYNNNKTSSLREDENQRKRCFNNDDDDDDENSVKKLKIHNYNDNVNSSEEHFNAIITLLQKQNEILMTKNNDHDHDDTFRTFLLAKLSLLQDIPRTSTKWIKEFQTIMNEAFDNVYNKFINDSL